MDAGKMPALKSLVENGVMGNLATLDPRTPIVQVMARLGRETQLHLDERHRNFKITDKVILVISLLLVLLASVNVYYVRVLYRDLATFVTPGLWLVLASIFSIFEPHTDVIVKDRRETLFGHKVTLSGGASGLIIDIIKADGERRHRLRDPQAHGQHEQDRGDRLPNDVVKRELRGEPRTNETRNEQGGNSTDRDERVQREHRPKQAHAKEEPCNDGLANPHRFWPSSTFRDKRWRMADPELVRLHPPY